MPPEDTAAIQANAAAARTTLVLGGIVLVICLGGAVLLAGLRILEGSFVGYLLSTTAAAATTAIFMSRNGNGKNHP